MSLILARLGGGGPVTYTYLPTGGITFAGTAPRLYAKTFNVSGGVVFGGAATTTHATVFTYVATGGLVFAGVAPHSRTKAYQPIGNILFDGAAGTLYTSAGGGGVRRPMKTLYWGRNQ